MVMTKLGLEIPEFRIKRQISIQSSDEKDATTLSVQGKDMDGLPFSFLREVRKMDRWIYGQPEMVKWMDG